MNEQLLYSPEHYRERLSAYAKDTVEYISPNRFIRYNVNRKGNPAVVEEVEGQFIVYFRERTDDTFLTASPRNAAFAPQFLAKIRIEQTVEMEICRFNVTFKPSSIVLIIALGILLFISVVRSKNIVSNLLIFFVPYLLLSYLFIRKEKKDFRTLIITFLNTIAAS